MSNTGLNINEKAAAKPDFKNIFQKAPTNIDQNFEY